MGNGYKTEPVDGMDQLVQIIADARRRLRELEALDGTQIYDTVQNMKNLIDGLLDQVNGIFTGYVQAGTTITAGGDITSTSGRGYFASTLWSVGSSATDLSGIAGLRQNTWQIYSGPNTGLYGYSPSSFRKKTHWRRVTLTAAQFMACFPYVYEYRGQVAIRDDKNHPNYDPDYVVPLEIGYLAELLVKNGLGIFVTMKNGVAIGIDYAAFAAVGMTIIGREQEARMDALEKRLEAAGF